MRPIKVEFQAFGPYAGSETVNFEEIASKGLFLICGKTGTGKTMILDAMTFALYGKSSGHGRDNFEAMRCTNADYDTTTYVCFEFENQGEYYRFERRLVRKRKNLSAEYNVMQKDANGDWQPLFENAKEKLLNDKAVEIIGLEYDQFRQVIVLPQGQFEKLLTSNSDEKEKILTSIFGEEKWQKIAEKLYEEAIGRKDGLKEKKDRIFSSLQEENCETLEQLTLLIVSKEEELRELAASFAQADYEKVIKENNESIALAKRFKDLHNAEKSVSEYGLKQEERTAWEKQLQDAQRAEKVRELLEQLEATHKSWNTRTQEEVKAEKYAIAAADAAKKAKTVLEEHLKTESAAEEKKAVKIRYEEKKADYEGIQAVEEELAKKVSAENTAKQEEAKAKKAYDVYAPKIVEARKQYDALDSEHRALLDVYLVGITGEIASRLEEGKPCPVCGSMEHPHKAVMADNSVSKEAVDAKKSLADSKYQEMQELIQKQDTAKNAWDQKHSAVEAAHTSMVEVDSRLQQMKANLVQGIDSLEALRSAITALESEIKGYEEKKLVLQNADRLAQETYTDAKAKLEPAKRETANALEQYEEAKERLSTGLKENHFANEEEAKELLMSENETNLLHKKMTEYDAGKKVAQQTLENLQSELKDVPEPDVESCNRKIEEATRAKSEFDTKKGILQTEINRLTEKSKRLEAEGEGIEDQILEAEEDVIFAKKLRGDSGTGLQRYVLGIMFSSVVAAANRMLEMVHGGRYRLYRSDEKAQGTNKRGLELKVFDKNSDDHDGRFVSTLSGGEKFLASLALSIGMSTVAQKSGIRIEALFIDEGFGSLDEDSIGDAMSILDSIREANGLVGIISHVQLLQERIPTKLQVEETEKGSRIVRTIG